MTSSTYKKEIRTHIEFKKKKYRNVLIEKLKKYVHAQYKAMSSKRED